MEKGIQIEYKLIALLLEKGFNVSIPCDNHCHYDLIIDLNGKFLRVQVKSCISKKSRNRYRVDMACGCFKNKKPYPMGSLELFIVYILEENAWYVIPQFVVGQQRFISVCPHVSTSKFEQYKERWDLIS